MFKDENRHYSLRKLSVSLASVLIGISFASATGNSVKADTVNGQMAKQTTVANSSDVAKQGSTKVDSSTVVPNNDGKTTTKEQQRATIEGQEQATEAAKCCFSIITLRQ